MQEVREKDEQSPMALLEPNEQAVARMLAQGMSNEQIAARLGFRDKRTISRTNGQIYAAWGLADTTTDEKVARTRAAIIVREGRLLIWDEQGAPQILDARGQWARVLICVADCRCIDTAVTCVAVVRSRNLSINVSRLRLLMNYNFLIALDWAIISLSLFNTIAFLWLGFTVLLNVERRRWGSWAAGGGLILGGLFFAGHTAVVSHTLDQLGPDTEFWWRVSWLPVVGAPYMWYLMIAWYTGVLQRAAPPRVAGAGGRAGAVRAAVAGDRQPAAKL